jgi:hypothetical protein
MEYQMTETGKAEWDRQCRVSDIAHGVEAGLHKFFEKRGGPDWFCRAKDGTGGVRLNGTFSLEEIGAHIVAELTGQTAADLIGGDFVPEF